MLITKNPCIPSSEITPERTYMNRRRFIQSVSGLLFAQASNDEKQTPYKDVTTYNNFYEFGIDKDAPARNAKQFQNPAVDSLCGGLCQKAADVCPPRAN